MKNLIGFTLLMILLFIGVISLAGEIKNKENMEIGGLCEYRAYGGKARITSISLKEMTDSSETRYEVKFLFFPDREIKEPWFKVKDREYLILLNNNEFPGQALLKKYEFKIGKMVDCTLRIIVRGTCTPFIFEFPFSEENP